MEEVRTGEASRDIKAKIDDTVRRAGASAEGHLGFRGTWGSLGIGGGAGADWVWRTSDGREYSITLDQATSDRLLKSTEARLAQNQTYQHLRNEARAQMKASGNEAMFSRVEQARASFQTTQEEARRVQQDYDLSERYEAVLRADIMPQVLDRMWEAQGTGMTFGQAVASGHSPAAYLAGSFAARIDSLTRTAVGCQEFVREARRYILKAGLYEKLEEAQTAIEARRGQLVQPSDPGLQRIRRSAPGYREPQAPKIGRVASEVGRAAGEAERKLSKTPEEVEELVASRADRARRSYDDPDRRLKAPDWPERPAAGGICVGCVCGQAMLGRRTLTSHPPRFTRPLEACAGFLRRSAAACARHPTAHGALVPNPGAYEPTRPATRRTGPERAPSPREWPPRKDKKVATSRLSYTRVMPLTGAGSCGDRIALRSRRALSVEPRPDQADPKEQETTRDGDRPELPRPVRGDPDRAGDPPIRDPAHPFRDAGRDPDLDARLAVLRRPCCPAQAEAAKALAKAFFREGQRAAYVSGEMGVGKSQVALATKTPRRPGREKPPVHAYESRFGKKRSAVRMFEPSGVLQGP
jgi:hypothetical protein